MRLRVLMNRGTGVVKFGVYTSTVYSMCLCVFFLFILDTKFVGRTSRGHTGGRSHRISHPPCYTYSITVPPYIVFAKGAKKRGPEKITQVSFMI